MIGDRGVSVAHRRGLDHNRCDGRHCPSGSCQGEEVETDKDQSQLGSSVPSRGLLPLTRSVQGRPAWRFENQSIFRRPYGLKPAVCRVRSVDRADHWSCQPCSALREDHTRRPRPAKKPDSLPTRGHAGLHAASPSGEPVTPGTPGNAGCARSSARPSRATVWPIPGLIVEPETATRSGCATAPIFTCFSSQAA